MSHVRAADARPRPDLVPVLLAALDAGFLLLTVVYGSWGFYFLGPRLFWMAAYGYVLLRIAMTLPEFVAFLAGNMIYLSFPALCFVSVLWSAFPGHTIYYSMMITQTILVALFLAMRFDIKVICYAVFLGLALTVLGSLANLGGALAPAYNEAHRFMGVFLGKSALGMALTQFVLVSTFFAFLLPGAWPVLRLAALAGLGLAAALLSIAGSATGILMSIVAAGSAVVLYAIFFSPVLRVVVLAGLAFVVSIGGVALLLTGQSPETLILSAVGRDPTLTGRTVLWAFGWQSYLQTPLLGAGANVFWNDPTHAARVETLRGLFGESIKSFHNIVVELLVMLGPLGLLSMLAMLATTAVRAVRRIRYAGDPHGVWVLLATLAILITDLTDDTLQVPQYLSLILIVCTGAALSQDFGGRDGGRRFERLSGPAAKGVGGPLLKKPDADLRHDQR